MADVAADDVTASFGADIKIGGVGGVISAAGTVSSCDCVPLDSATREAEVTGTRLRARTCQYRLRTVWQSIYLVQLRHSRKALIPFARTYKLRSHRS